MKFLIVHRPTTRPTHFSQNPKFLRSEMRSFLCANTYILCCVLMRKHFTKYLTLLIYELKCCMEYTINVLKINEVSAISVHKTVY